jgi:hypothetical protein
MQLARRIGLKLRGGNRCGGCCEAAKGSRQRGDGRGCRASRERVNVIRATAPLLPVPIISSSRYAAMLGVVATARWRSSSSSGTARAPSTATPGKARTGAEDGGGAHEPVKHDRSICTRLQPDDATAHSTRQCGRRGPPRHTNPEMMQTPPQEPRASCERPLTRPRPAQSYIFMRGAQKRGANQSNTATRRRGNETARQRRQGRQPPNNARPTPRPQRWRASNMDTTLMAR